jgi:hypothetical protein
MSSAWFGQPVVVIFPSPAWILASVLRFFSPRSGLPAPYPFGVVLNPAHHVRLCGKNEERVFATTLPSCAPGVGPLGFGPEAQSRRALAARKTGLSKARASIANTCAGKSSLGGQRERHFGVGYLPGDVLLGVSVRFGQAGAVG